MKCPRCGGTGEIESDREVGERMRSLREGKGLTLREVSRRMGVSAAYVSDLERGRRAWNTSVTEKYFRALR